MGQTNTSKNPDACYFRIDFTGVRRAWYKYIQLQNACHKLVGIMRSQGQQYEAESIHCWMRSTGGFVRPHMPYYVTLGKQEHDDLMAGFREHMPVWYTRARYYGKWV